MTKLFFESWLLTEVFLKSGFEYQPDVSSCSSIFTSSKDFLDFTGEIYKKFTATKYYGQ